MSIDNKIRLTFWSGVGSITGGNFMLNFGGKKMLVDCGLIQGGKEAWLENRNNFEYNPSEIKYLFITHAHLDHVGRIPKLVKDGFRGKIFSTPETKELAYFILEDATGIMGKEALAEGITPLYEMRDVNDTMSMWEEIPYHTEKEFDKEEKLGSFSVYLRDAGHILGSSIIEFKINTLDDGGAEVVKKISFTGDLGNTPSTLLKDTEPPVGTEYLVMESVYGDRNHESHDERRHKLKQAIIDVVERKGTLLIPAFSLERTQVLLSEINDFVEAGEVPSIPVFVDSPLAIKITGVYQSYENDFNESSAKRISSGDDIFDFPRLKFTEGMRDSKELEKVKVPKIIIAGSGMSVGGRVIRHEKELLPNPNNIFLLVGYQTLGTIGRMIQDGAKKVRIDHEDIKVAAEVRTVFGYSSHKDSDHLLEFVDMTLDKDAKFPSIKRVFVVMGEMKSSLFLAQKIHDNLGIDAIYPERAKEYLI
ncbi:MAG: MBL fold metallo-hydrolase [bacterium]|nr:MBL fold metallo-hydrolase [bacterium]